MPDCFPCVCSPLLAVFSHRFIFYANTLVSITPGLALLALPSLFQFFSFPVPPSLSAYLSCSLLFSTDSSFIATIRLFYFCPVFSLTSPFVFPLFPNCSSFITTISLAFVSSYQIVLLAFSHHFLFRSVSSHLLTFYCNSLVVIASCLSLPVPFFLPLPYTPNFLSQLLFLPFRIFLPAHLLSQLSGCHYCLVISLRLSFRSFSLAPFLLLLSNHNPMDSIVSSYLIVLLASSLPSIILCFSPSAHLLSQLFGCYCCPDFSLTLPFVFHFLRVSHRLIFYANALVSITPWLSLLSLPLLPSLFSLPIFFFCLISWVIFYRTLLVVITSYLSLLVPFFLSLPYTLNFLSQLIFLPLRIFFACSSFITTLDCYYPITGYFFYSCLLFFPFSLTWRSSTVYFLLPRPSLPFSLSFSPYFPTCSPFIATFWLLLLPGYLSPSHISPFFLFHISNDFPPAHL